MTYFGGSQNDPWLLDGSETDTVTIMIMLKLFCFVYEKHYQAWKGAA